MDPQPTTGGETQWQLSAKTRSRRSSPRNSRSTSSSSSPEAKFIEDLGADSLDIVELVMALEEEFGIDIPDEDADKLKTVGDAMNYLK